MNVPAVYEASKAESMSPVPALWKAASISHCSRSRLKAPIMFTKKNMNSGSTSEASIVMDPGADSPRQASSFRPSPTARRSSLLDLLKGSFSMKSMITSTNCLSPDPRARDYL